MIIYPNFKYFFTFIACFLERKWSRKKSICRNSNLHLVNLISGGSYFFSDTNRANGTNTDTYNSSGVMINLMHPSRVIDTSFHLLAIYREWDYGFSKIKKKKKHYMGLFSIMHTFNFQLCILRRFVVKLKTFLNWFWYKKV